MSLSFYWSGHVTSLKCPRSHTSPNVSKSLERQLKNILKPSKLFFYHPGIKISIFQVPKNHSKIMSSVLNEIIFQKQLPLCILWKIQSLPTLSFQRMNMHDPCMRNICLQIGLRFINIVIIIPLKAILEVPYLGCP